MTLYTTDYLEYYLTLVSWIVHNGVWNVLVASGVFAIPFLAIVIQEWLKARAEGADEGNKGMLSSARIENRVFVAIVVIMFAGIPFIDVDFTTLQFDRSCVLRPPCICRRLPPVGQRQGIRLPSRPPRTEWMRYSNCSPLLSLPPPMPWRRPSRSQPARPPPRR